jgi:BirA family transcriptional regulator, biotin operon repressor / biotin---[acetyl-CoA-carboxylase] ligase
MQAPLNIAELRAALVGTRFAARLHHFPTLESSNTLLLEAAANGAPEGTLYLADEQTRGRGRGGHAWHSSPGDGLYLSVLAKPSLRLREALLISLATGLAARSAIKSTIGIGIDLRWPNDLLFAGKKLGGILVETAVEPDADATLRYAVIGIGININHECFPADLAPIATSLRLATGQQQSRNTLLIALLRALDFELTQLETQQLEAQQPNLLERFTAASTWVFGKRVHVPEQGGYTGITAGLDSRGFLLVNTDDSTQRTVLSGGVREAASAL